MSASRAKVASGDGPGEAATPEPDVGRWSLCAVDGEVLAELLSGTSEHPARRLLAGLTWELEEPQREELTWLGTHLRDGGATYDGLEGERAAALDEWIWGLPALDSFGEELGSSDGCAESTYVTVILKIWEHTTPSNPDLVVALRGGRRLGTGERPAATVEYVVFSPIELDAMRDDLEAAWPSLDAEDQLGLESIRSVLARALGEGRALLATSDT